MRRLLKLLLISIVALAALGGAGLWHLATWSTYRLPTAGATEFDVERGISLRALADKLESLRLVSSADRLILWARWQGNFGRVQAGHYRIDGEVSPRDVLQILTDGQVYVPTVLQVTVPEGFTMRQVAARLEANGVGKAREIERILRDREFLRQHQIPGTSAEGFLYPATYSYSTFPSPHKVLGDMAAAFWQNLPAQYEDKVSALGISLREAVIMASLIEREAAAPEEKTLISEVIWRRLKSGTPLGMDAAIIYGIEDYSGDIRWKDLSDRSNPYNTRVHRGLPPTAIGSVSRSSLEAVLSPTDFGYMYYVLVPDGQGKHHFSRTHQEHMEHVRKLVAKTRPAQP